MQLVNCPHCMKPLRVHVILATSIPAESLPVRCPSCEWRGMLPTAKKHDNVMTCPGCSADVVAAFASAEPLDAGDYFYDAENK